MILLYVLGYLASSSLVIYIGACIYTHSKLKTEMLNEQKKAEDEAWVNQLISNIKGQSDELVN